MMNLRQEGRPGIFFTMGPEADNPSQVTDLITEGATLMRTVFSYREPPIHEQRAKLVKEAAKNVGKDITVVADLPGGKIRIHNLNGKQRKQVREGESLDLVPVGREGDITVDSNALFEQVGSGDTIIVGDGSLTMKVKNVTDDRIHCEVIREGTIELNRGLTVRDGSFEPPTLRKQDCEYLEYVAKSGVFDAVALSFVSDPKEITTARSILESHDSQLPIIAKIESAGGIESLTDITSTADAVMAARGDLALYLPWENLEAYTARIAREAQATDTPWILATQVAEGLENFDSLTRAETCDLSRWVNDGVEAVLLSHETAFGSNPVKAVSEVRDLLEAVDNG